LLIHRFLEEFLNVFVRNIRTFVTELLLVGLGEKLSVLKLELSLDVSLLVDAMSPGFFRHG
jgi:hypothetical protein